MEKFDSKDDAKRYVNKLEERNIELYTLDPNEVVNRLKRLDIKDIVTFLIVSVPMAYYMPQSINALGTFAISLCAGSCITLILKHNYNKFKIYSINKALNKEIVANADSILEIKEFYGLDEEKCINDAIVDESITDQMKKILSYIENLPDDAKRFYLYQLNLVQNGYMKEKEYNKDCNVKIHMALNTIQNSIESYYLKYIIIKSENENINLTRKLKK